jgi:hypothetical protein
MIHNMKRSGVSGLRELMSSEISQGYAAENDVKANQDPELKAFSGARTVADHISFVVNRGQDHFSGEIVQSQNADNPP